MNDLRRARRRADGDETLTVTEDAGETAIANLLDNTDDPESEAPGTAAKPTVISAGGVSTATGDVTVAGSTGGTFKINSDGTASFDPGLDFIGLDTGETAVSTITYEVQDANGDIVSSTVTVTITGADNAEDFVADDDTFGVIEGEEIQGANLLLGFAGTGANGAASRTEFSGNSPTPFGNEDLLVDTPAGR